MLNLPQKPLPVILHHTYPAQLGNEQLLCPQTDFAV